MIRGRAALRAPNAHSSATVPCPLLQDHQGQWPGFSVLWNLLFIMLGITTIRPRSLLRGAVHSSFLTVRTAYCLVPMLPQPAGASARLRFFAAGGIWLRIYICFCFLSFPTFVFLTLCKNSSYFRLPQSSFANEWRYKSIKSFPGGTSGKEPICQCRRHKRCGFYPWAGKIPWRRAWQPTPVFLPGE